MDYHFRDTEAIRQLGREPDRYIVMRVRGDVQALDAVELQRRLNAGPVLFEGNPFVGRTLAEDDRLNGVRRRSMFLAPLGAEELDELADAGQPFANAVYRAMRGKLERRTRCQQGGDPDEAAREDIETRARSAFGELKMVPAFDWVVVNHDGEDSDHWTALRRPVGDARRTLGALVDLLEGRPPRGADTRLGESVNR